MRTRSLVALGVVTAAGLVMSQGAAAHESPNEGHIPSNVNYGFDVVGHDLLAGVQDGLYTDVWSHAGYAYVGTFQEPGCTDAGVFVVDIQAAVDNYPDTTGATVAEIRSAPNTRINDVKVHTVGDVDVLIATQEPCGQNIPGAAISGVAPGQVGQGGISLYDVSDPTKPKALKQNFLEFGGVHNTFAWDWAGKSYLIGTANTFDYFDTFFVDISKPQSPKLLTTTGALDWLAVGAFGDAQFETGSSAGIFNHDVWVEIIDNVPTAVVSYWDVGFVTLDVTDPANPVFLGDSTYPDPEPIVGEPYEGNAHAAVFGGNGDYIFGGDEDFSPSSFGISYDGTEYPAGVALFGDDPNTLAGNVEYVGGEGCTAGSIGAPTVPEPQVALIDRGSCFFSDKGYNAEAAGYEGYIIANNNGDGLINMSPGDGALPTIPGVFVGQSTGDAIKAAPGLPVSTDSIYDGWGYLHIINNTGEAQTVPSEGRASDATMNVPQLGELGYYAPRETVTEVNPDTGEPYGTEFGDLTMHNIEVDPSNQDATPSYFDGPRMFVSWYSLGMRALEYRPGHYHADLNDEGFYSQNVHEVGRWIDPNGGSNFWGVHVDEVSADVDGDGEADQVILASDRNTGLWIFTFSCETTLETGETVFYCVIPGSEGDGEGGG
jgi:hypothetical protein